MDIFVITGIVAFASLVFSVVLFALRWVSIRRLPFGKDFSVPKDSAARGIRYAFTLGMAPWAKESTRRHLIAYLRGIGFHQGILAGLIAFVLSPWINDLNYYVRIGLGVLAGMGALLGVAGGVLRIAERDLRSISTPDDHASVWLVSLFLGTVAVSYTSASLLPAMYLAAALMFLYAPVSKIRHCIYFYFGRLFFGTYIGRRGIVRGLEASHGQ